MVGSGLNAGGGGRPGTDGIGPAHAHPPTPSGAIHPVVGAFEASSGWLAEAFTASDWAENSDKFRIASRAKGIDF